MGRIEFDSPSAERALGYNPVELPGRNAFEFVHPDDVAATAERFQHAIGGASVATEFRFRHKDGTYRWLEAVRSNRSDDPAVGGVVINSRDVTPRRAADERLRLLESVAVNARDAILITEAEPVELPRRGSSSERGVHEDDRLYAGGDHRQNAAHFYRGFGAT